jgi:GAF domain-containing protein
MDTVLAQQQVPLVGFLNSASPDTYRFNADSFREGLRKAGSVEGSESRFNEAKYVREFDATDPFRTVASTASSCYFAHQAAGWRWRIMPAALAGGVDFRMVELAALIKLCHHVEALAPGSAAGMTLTDQDHTHIERAFFPSLPDSFSLALTDVALEPSGFGSCVKAIACGQTITCPDIQTDHVFDPRWRSVCLDYGLRSIQSRPVYVNGKARGTFVLAYRHARPESEWDVALMTFAADAATEALSK